MWATEALFPGYVFARFDYLPQHRRIRALPGITGIVEFGPEPAIVDDGVIAALRGIIGDAEVLQASDMPEPNSEVIMVDGPLRGLQLLVTRVMPARDRIAVLLEILGTVREVEVSVASTIAVERRSGGVVGDLRRA